MANITFKNGEMARRAVEKFNGAPIDGGRTKLRLNLIIDPNQQPVRSLNDRIGAVPNQRNMVRQGDRQRPIQQRPIQQRPGQQRSGQLKQGQQQQQKPKAPTKKAAAAKARKQTKKDKPVKKSLEDLDKEMADYFEEKK